MIDYIKGTLTEITPTFITLETGGIGYFINVSITTFSKLEGKNEFKVLVHEVIREDSHQLFGFADSEESIILAVFAPTPETEISNLKISRSSLLANPKSR